MDFTKEQLSDVFVKHLDREKGLQDLMELMIESMMRSKTNVLGDVGLMFIGYNLGRCVTILRGGETLLNTLKTGVYIIYPYQKWLILSLFKEQNMYALKISL